MSEKINDLKTAMKEILNTPINLLQGYENFENLSPTLEEIFTRYNISEMQFVNYIEHIFTYIKRILEEQGKNFDLKSSTIDLISGEDLLPIIKAFIYFIMGIKDPNEISNIQQQIISELDKQKFESQNLFQLKQELLPPTMFEFADVDVMKKVFEQNYPHNTNFDSEKNKLGFIFDERPKTGSEANSFKNTAEIYGHNPLEKINLSSIPTYSIFSNNKSNTNDLSSSEILNSESKLNENQIIEQQIEQFKNDVAIRSAMQDISKLLNLIKILNNMRDKLSEVFSPQAIKNAINFLEDILKNNNEEINSVINMIKEFDDINDPSSIIHFLHNFSRRYPEVMGSGPIPKSEIGEQEIEH